MLLTFVLLSRGVYSSFGSLDSLRRWYEIWRL